MEAEPEVTVICMDTSRWFKSTRSARFKKQADAIELYTTKKLNSHPENVVGVFATTFGYVVGVVKPCRDLRQIMDNIYCVTIHGTSNLIDAMKLAPIVYDDSTKRMRIAAFVGGRLPYVKEEMQYCGKFIIKKNNRALDVVNFGYRTNHKRLPETLVAAADNNGNSRIVHVPCGSTIREALSKFIGESSVAPLGSLSMQERSKLMEKDYGENLEQITQLIAKRDALTEEVKNLKKELESFRKGNNQVAR